jgi:hypothetical protein
MRKYVAWLFAALAATGFLGCAGNYGSSPPNGGGGAYPSPAGPPLPLDPLRPDEAEAAQRIAQSDPRVREVLGESPRLIYVQSIAPKIGPNADEPRGRHADVLYLSGNQELGIRVLVDLGGSRVVEHVRLPQNKVPLGIADVQEALRLAVQHGAVREMLGARASGFRVLTGPITPSNANSDYVSGLRHVAGSAEDPCYRNRCLYLLFNSGGRLLLDHEVLVNLSTREVRVTSTREGANR